MWFSDFSRLLDGDSSNSLTLHFAESVAVFRVRVLGSWQINHSKPMRTYKAQHSTEIVINMRVRRAGAGIVIDIVFVLFCDWFSQQMLDAIIAVHTNH